MASPERSRRAVEARARERLGALAYALQAGEPPAEATDPESVAAGATGSDAPGSDAPGGDATSGDATERGATPTDAVDSADIVARLRAGALGAAATAYTAAHGHPLDREDPLLEPPTRRWLLSRRAAVAVSLALFAVVAVVVLRAWAAAPPDVVPFGAGKGVHGEAPTGREATDPFAPGEASGGAARLVVHVVGEVTHPGVVELEPGARVAEAVAAAGGATRDADLGGLNLARLVEDGEQVVVPGPGSAAEGPGSPSSSDPRIDLNAADAATLETLPGVGPVLAERIIAWREEHGRFSAVAELLEVSGIGPSIFGQLEELVRV